jgi:hypothetical protein
VQLPYAFATNGKKIRQINMLTGEEKDVSVYPGPKELLDSLSEPANPKKESADTPKLPLRTFRRNGLDNASCKTASKWFDCVVSFLELTRNTSLSR